jgi:hypothetical protein
MDEKLKNALVAVLECVDEKTSAQNFWTRTAAIANSPFVLTIVGGILLAAVSGLITQCNAQNTRERELAVERLKAKQAFVQTFSSKMERYFELTLSLRKREIFLSGWQSHEQRSSKVYPDGRNYDETRDFWEKEKRYWLDQSTDSPIGLINAGKLLFKDTAVRNALNKLTNATQRYGSATRYSELSQAYTDALDCLEKTSISMADHVYEE